MKTYEEVTEYMIPTCKEMQTAIKKRKHWEEQCETGTEMYKHLKHEEDKAVMEFWGICEAAAIIFNKKPIDVFKEVSDHE